MECSTQKRGSLGVSSLEEVLAIVNRNDMLNKEYRAWRASAARRSLVDTWKAERKKVVSFVAKIGAW